MTDRTLALFPEGLVSAVQASLCTYLSLIAPPKRISANKVEHSDTERQNTVPANLGAPAVLPFFAADVLRLLLSEGGVDDTLCLVEGLGWLEVGKIELEDTLPARKLYS